MPLILGIVRGADDDEVVVHEVVAVLEQPSATALSSCSLACTMTTSASPRLPISMAGAGAHGHYVHLDAGLLCEDGQQVVEQPGVLGAGGGGALEAGFGQGGAAVRTAAPKQTAMSIFTIVDFLPFVRIPLSGLVSINDRIVWRTGRRYTALRRTYHGHIPG